ncbi:hypothetical protein HCU40_16955 [Pseudanabaena biceps]|nr:hypothetical protein [Pseudanabaena biceps]
MSAKETITLDELKLLRENLRDLRRTIASRRRQLNRERTIGIVEYNQMIASEDLISDLIDAIADEIFSSIIVDLNQGVAKIQTAIDKANEAIAQLQKLNNILRYINLIIGLVQNILFIANTGDVARIAIILDQIDQLPKTE